MIKFIIPYLFYSVYLYNVVVNANELESLKQRNIENVLKCAKEIPVSQKELDKYRQLQMPEDENTNCLMACIFKSLGLMDDQGMLSVEGLNELGRIYMSEDPERTKQAKQMADTCVSVNDVEVSDGDKGCERAALMYLCSLEKVPEFDFM